MNTVRAALRRLGLKRSTSALHDLRMAYANGRFDGATYTWLGYEGPAAMAAAVKRLNRGEEVTAPTEDGSSHWERELLFLELLRGVIDRETYDRVCQGGQQALVAAIEMLKRGERVDGNVGDTAAAAAVSSETLITQLLEENEQSGSLHFSRACCVCLMDSPRRRAVFTGCGHAICLACAERMKVNAGSANIGCPYCRTVSTFVPLIEQSWED